jgi:hypothetical protein
MFKHIIVFSLLTSSSWCQDQKFVYFDKHGNPIKEKSKWELIYDQDFKKASRRINMRLNHSFDDCIHSMMEYAYLYNKIGDKEKEAITIKNIDDLIKRHVEEFEKYDKTEELVKKYGH